MSVGEDGVPGRRLCALTNVIIVMILQLKEPPRRSGEGKGRFLTPRDWSQRLCTVYSGTRDGSRRSAVRLLVRRRGGVRERMKGARSQNHLMAISSTLTPAPVKAIKLKVMVTFNKFRLHFEIFWGRTIRN